MEKNDLSRRAALKSIIAVSFIGPSLEALASNPASYRIIPLDIRSIEGSYRKFEEFKISKEGWTTGTYQFIPSPYTSGGKSGKKIGVWSGMNQTEIDLAIFDGFNGGAIKFANFRHGFGFLLYEEDKTTKEREYFVLEDFSRQAHLKKLDFKPTDMNSNENIAGHNYARIKFQGIVKIGPDDGRDYIGLAINDNDTIVGNIYTPGEYFPKPFEWKNGEVAQLPIIDGIWGGVIGINNLGQIIGYYMPGGGRGGISSQPCIWDNGEITELTQLREANGINNRGDIVGMMTGYKRAALLRSDGELINLTSCITRNPSDQDDWSYLYKALGISDNGFIIGRGVKNRADHILPNDDSPSFLMQPHLTADLNDDGIVNGLDLAELGNQWLGREDGYEE